ncbi:polysaccharide biosynthesis tyrosine autokinase [Maribacter algarum]|uniref:non-specific protein-tyrosine kinase n=1 Tax=Maribacter algarum (ex Zhang et al. 2020) TaxID=2578118 RepID=A0A5S3PY55_9FLAO|nr:polysaccharide biosynthesis tyrosine autokinase [Maribacter algarum]TMM58227.1 polysaccharide biosynthesis tyrosine autokinase [Maribacter algarum]
MKENKDSQFNAQHEVNLKLFFQKILQNKWFFILSIGLCLALAMVYIKLATPKYEASTSILIDASGSRALGDSKYVDGGVGLIDVEKNLYNEIGIIKSFSLIRQTVEDLGFDVSYHTKGLIKEKESYGYFPIVVTLDKSKSQLYGVPFEIEMLPNDTYRITIEGDDFTVSNPVNGSTREIKRDFRFSKEYRLGQPVIHDYFNFTLEKPEYKVLNEDFKEEQLSFTISSLDAVAGGYASKIGVSNIDIQASIFKITSSGTLVAKEVDFLKKLTENYVESKLTSRNKIASAKEDFIRNQLKVVSDSLTKVELSLENFKKDKRALDLSATASNALGRTSNLQMQKAKIKLNVDYYNSLIQNIQDNRNSEEFVIPTAIGIDDRLINENVLELKRLYAERSKKKFYVTSTNQEMNILNKQIDESTDLLLSNLRNSIKSSEFTLERINSQLSSYNGVISSLPNQENQLLTIERQSALYENLFNYLSQELAKTGIAGAENTSDTRILDEARMVGTGPVSPQKPLLLLLALIVGTLIPMAWIVLFSSRDIIENVGQIMANSDIPVIASIVHHESKGKKSKSDVSLWKFKESFRDLSTNLRFVSSKEPCVLGVTSIMPEEGKTYSAINLGITFAEAGKRTLIIDMDLRNPSLVNRVNKVEGKGLYNYLRGNVFEINDITYPHEELSNLKFIPTSLAEGNVHELLSGSRLKNLVEELKGKFDYIILDTPAAGLVSDFMLLSEVIDINLFVVRRKIARIKFLEDLKGLILKNKKSFIIFNDVPKKDHKYGYEEKYGKNKEDQLVNESLSV